MSQRSRGARLLQALVALTCLTFLLTPIGSAGADPVASELASSWGALPDSATISSPPADTGVLTDSAGAPVADASVVLFAEPANATLDQMAIGDTADLVPLSRATTAADGSWTLRVPSGLDLTPDAQLNDTGDYSVNVIAESFDANGSDAHGFTLDVGVQTNVGIGPISTPDPGPLHVSPRDPSDGSAIPDGSTQVATADLNGAEQPVSVPDSDPTSLTDGDMAVTPDVDIPGGLKPCNAPYCTGCQVEKLDSADVTSHIGSLYAATSGTSQTFSYTRGSTSSLGEGISTSGSLGSYKQSGTSSISSSVTETFPTLTGQGYKYYYTRFRYGKYRVNCWKFTPNGTGGYTKKRYVLGYWWQATGFEGGATSSNTSGILAGNCVWQEKGSKYSIDKTRAYEWVAGADSGGILGFWLSSRTGFSTSTSIHMSFSTGRHLCGKYGYPGGSPQLLLVKS